jgi:GxxExxY protein
MNGSPMKSLGRPLRYTACLGQRVVLELKAVDQLRPIHEAQLLSYLKATGLRLGLLMNFNVKMMKDGIKRLIR